MDLTRSFTAGAAVPIGGAEPAKRRQRLAHDRDGFYAQWWTLDEHTGTHVDAPSHRVPGAADVDDLLPAELVVPLRVIDISGKALADPDAQLTAGDVLDHEQQYGPVPAGAAVFLHSGWGSRPAVTQAYLNLDADGLPHSPGFHSDAATLLLARGAVCLGSDTASLDPGSSTLFPVHDIWLGASKFGVEGLTNLGDVPAAGAHVVIGVVPWEHGSGGPCRVLCLC